MEVKWSAKARDRRYVVLQGRTPESGVIERDPDAKDGSLITAQGVEERVKVQSGPVSVYTSDDMGVAV